MVKNCDICGKEFECRGSAIYCTECRPDAYRKLRRQSKQSYVNSLKGIINKGDKPKTFEESMKELFNAIEREQRGYKKSCYGCPKQFDDNCGEIKKLRANSIAYRYEKVPGCNCPMSGC